MSGKQQEKKVISHFGNFKVHKGLYLSSEDLKGSPFFKLITRAITRKKAHQSQKILEIGCGGGNVLENVNKYFPGNKLYGLDLSPHLVKYAKGKRSKKIDFKKGNVFNLPYRTDSFDFVLMENLLHHLVGRSRENSKDLVVKALSEAVRVLKKDGYLVVDENLVSHKFKAYWLFYLTNIYSRINVLGLEIPKFKIYKNVITSFLTQEEFLSLTKSLGMETIYKDIFVWKMDTLTGKIERKILQYIDRNIFYIGKVK